MGLTKYKFGDLICQRREKYDGEEDLPSWGVSREGFIRPRQTTSNKSIYNVFYKNDFVLNPARMELNSIALNTRFDKAICSSLYEIFYISRLDLVLPEYLNLFIKRSEFARKCWFEAIGSSYDYCRVADLAEFEIELPPLPIQQKYVDVYKTMLENQQCYEEGLEDLKLVCDAYIEKLRDTTTPSKIGSYIHECTDQNGSQYGLESVKGLSVEKKFIQTKANMTDVNLSNYKLVKPGQITYVTVTSRNSNKITVAMNDSDETYLVSGTYIVFKTDSDILLPEYLMLFFSRAEFDRYARFHSWGSARENFDWDSMCEVELPIPDVEVQQAIVNIYHVYNERKRIAGEMNALLKDMCPLLIKGSIEEAEKE